MAQVGKSVEMAITAKDEFSTAFTRLQAELKQARAGMDDHHSAINRNNSAFTTFTGTLGIHAMSVGVVSAALIGMSRNLITTASAAENLRLSFQAISGSAELGGRELEYIWQTANRLGLEFNGVAEAYKKLSAAAYGTALEGEPLRRIFEGMTEASKAVGMSSEETARVFMQMSQMMSKGKVELEDLKTVSESLPGAMNIAKEVAKSMGGDLYEMMKKGQLTTSQFLEPFVETLNSRFPLAVGHTQSLSSEVNRLSNSYYNLKTTVMSGGADGIFGTLIKGTRALTDELTSLAGVLDKTNTKWLAWVISPGLAYYGTRGSSAPPKLAGGASGERDPFSYSTSEVIAMRDAWLRKMNPPDDPNKPGSGRNTNTKEAFDRGLIPRGELNYFPYVDYETYMNYGRNQLTPNQSEALQQNIWARRNVEPSTSDLNSMGTLSIVQQAMLDENIYRRKLENLNSASVDMEKEFLATRAALRGDYSLMDDLRIEREMANWERTWAMETDSYEVYEQRKAEIAEYYATKRLESEEEKEMKKRMILQNTFSLAARNSLDFYNMTGNQHKVAFGAYKAFSVAETTISTYQSAQESYKALAGIPVVGPALGAAAAAAAIAAGTARVHAILATSSTGASSLADSGNNSVSSPSTSPVVTQPASSQQPVGNVTYVFHGNIIGEEKWVEENLIPMLNQAGSRNIKIEYARN